MSLLKKLNWKILVLLAVLGGAVGVFVAFGPPQLMAKTESPLFCSSCHVMESQYEAWFNVGAHRTIRCVDCHLPHESVIAYYFEKGRQGMHDVYVFSTGTTPELIRANEHSQEIIQQNCIRCHEETVESIVMGPQAFDRNCWDCHRDVAHGQRGMSTSSFQDSAVYPVK